MLLLHSLALLFAGLQQFLQPLHVLAGGCAA
jgi:hypothetical protein